MLPPIRSAIVLLSWLVVLALPGAAQTNFSTIVDFAVAKTSGTVETINGSCSTSAPCIARIGATPYRFTAGATATISGTSSTGNVYWCLTPAGALLVTHNLAVTITGSGLTVQSGVTGCPSGDYQLWVTTMTANVWDAITEAMDYRAALQVKPSPTAGTGIAITQADTDVISIDSAVTPTLGGTNAYTGTEDASAAIITRPVKSGTANPATCTAGYDLFINRTTMKLMLCTATNTWTSVGPP